MSQIPYDHRTKAGNRGDLLKHFILFSALKDIKRISASFRYLDVHAGYPCYHLQGTGAWQPGVGQFVDNYASTPVPQSRLNDFYDRLTDSSGRLKTEYPGSTTLVTEILRKCFPKRYEVFLCDTNPDVCAELMQFNRNNPNVHVFNRNGYQLAYELAPVDLIFIDPPNIDAQLDDYRQLIESCVDRQHPFIAWNALHGNPDTSGPSANCVQIRTLSQHWQIPLLEVRWENWHTRMCGCQMLLYLANGESLKQEGQHLARLMGWHSV